MCVFKAWRNLSLRCANISCKPGPAYRVSIGSGPGHKAHRKQTRLLIVATSSDHPSAAAMLSTRDRLRSFDRPALVLFSDSDPIFTRRAAEVMAELLPNSELDPPVAGAGHFLQEDRGELIGERIAAWLAAG